MICEYCGKEHNGSYGTGRFCSSSCKQMANGLNDRSCKCKFCGKEFRNGRALGGHVVSCKKNPDRDNTLKKTRETLRGKYDARNPEREHTIKCPVCGKIFTIRVRDKQFNQGEYRHMCSDRCSHTRAQNESTKRKISDGLKRHIKKYGYAGCARLGAERKVVEYSCEECGATFKQLDKRPSNSKYEQTRYFSHRFCSIECSNKHRNRLLHNKAKQRCDAGQFGGINNDTYKKHKHGWYNGLYCGSSWELAFVLYNVDHGKNVKRCKLKLPYTYHGKTYNYYPDYEVDGKVCEVKGFEDFKSQEKHKQYPDILWFNREKMRPIIEYAIKTYGKDFVRLLQDHV